MGSECSILVGPLASTPRGAHAENRRLAGRGGHGPSGARGKTTTRDCEHRADAGHHPRTRLVAVRRSPSLSLQQIQEVLAVGVGQAVGERLELTSSDEALVIGDLFDAGDLETLPELDGLDEGGGLQERLMRSRVEPREPSREGLDVELAAGQVLTIDVRDLELAARGRPEGSGDVDDLVVVEIEAGHREV